MGSEANSNSTTLSTRFEEVVLSRPSGVILGIGQDGLTYQALWEISKKVAKTLRLLFGGDKRHILIDAQKHPISLALIIACWILNWSYTFVDLNQPQSRILQIADSSRASLIVSRNPDKVLNFGNQVQAEVLNVFGFVVKSFLFAPYMFGRDTCYIMYTSGSTGTPKGVPIRSDQVLQLVDWLKKELRICDSDVLTSVNPWYFDNSVFDIYMSLLSGSSLLTVDIDSSSGSLDWIYFLIEKKPSIWFSVPSMLMLLQSLGAFKDSKFPNLRSIIFGGEAYPKEQLKLLIEDQGRKTDFISVYGPTETTCICSLTRIDAHELNSSSPFASLGEFPAFFNLGLHEAYILPSGEIAGELILGGSNVTDGYVNRLEKIGKFASLPKRDGTTETYYFTGDMVSYNAGLKRFCFLGRKDNQIKRFGFRIELEEIESRLEKEFGTNFIADFDSNRTLDLCLIFKRTELVNEEQVLRLVEKLLPSYMLPKYVFGVEKVLINSNGKKDRKQARALLENTLGLRQ